MLQPVPAAHQFDQAESHTKQEEDRQGPTENGLTRYVKTPKGFATQADHAEGQSCRPPEGAQHVPLVQLWIEERHLADAHGEGLGMGQEVETQGSEDDCSRNNENDDLGEPSLEAVS